MFGRTERKNPLQKTINDDLEGLRDDCIALFRNSPLTMSDIYGRGGPTPSTISKWLHKETRFPQLRTIQSFVIALGHRVAIVETMRTNRIK